jgi:hypothetical protein
VCSWEHVNDGPHVNHEAMVAMLRRHINPFDVECMGTLNRNYQWHITLRSGDDAKKLLGVGEDTLLNDETGIARKVRYEGLLAREVSLSVLRVPDHISDGVIRSLVASFAGEKGRVAYCHRQQFTTEDVTYTTTRFAARLQDVWPEAIPKRVTIDVNGEKFPVLILVKGRPCACFLCNEFDHNRFSAFWLR